MVAPDFPFKKLQIMRRIFICRRPEPGKPRAPRVSEWGSLLGVRPYDDSIVQSPREEFASSRKYRSIMLCCKIGDTDVHELSG